MNAEYTDSCRPLFKKLNILPIYSQYTFSLTAFVVKNINAFKSNTAIRSINNRQGSDLHPPTNLTKAQEAAYYSGIKIFSNLPLNIKQLSHVTNLNWPLKSFFQQDLFTPVMNNLNGNQGVIWVLVRSVTAMRF
jgi:hypothetical protein